MSTPQSRYLDRQSPFTPHERQLQSDLAIVGRQKVISIDCGVTEETVSRWKRAHWPIPAYQLFRLSLSTGDNRYVRELAGRAGVDLRIVPRSYVEQPQSLFFLIANHAAIYSELVKIIARISSGEGTREDEERGDKLVDMLRDATEQININLKNSKNAMIEQARKRRQGQD